MLDFYCERSGAGLLVEPINAVTNFSFVVAAWAAWTLARRTKSLSSGIWGLIFLSATIGVGSTLFHTFATSWARWLDFIPILLFQLCFFWLYLRQIVDFGASLIAVSLFGLLVIAYLGCGISSILNGSLIYAPAYLMLICLGLYQFWHCESEPFILLLAAGVFSLSLFFRSIDEAVCPHFPIGTHFLWHLLNGALLYLSMRSLIVNSKNTYRLR